MALRVQSIDEITTELADIYDGLISPKKIWRNHNNKLYLMLRAYAAGKVGINDAALSLRNRFDPAYCDDVDLYSTAKLVGTDFKAGTGSLLQITIQNKSDETSQVLAGGVYHYTSASGEVFSFQIANDYQFDPRETKEVTAISSHKGSFSVTTNADIKLSRADGETIHSDFLFSCTGNEGQQGYADEDVFSFRGRILNDASRQDHIKELELSIRNLPNIFECNIKQNESYDTEEIYDGFTLKPRELLIMITGSPTNDIAKLAAGEVLYATHKVSDDMVVYYENDAYINGRYPVYYKFHDKTDFALYIKYQYDSNKLKAAQIEEAITALFKPYTQMVTHIDTFTEKNVYDVLAGILLPDVVILDANIIDSDGNEVLHINTGHKTAASYRHYIQCRKYGRRFVKQPFRYHRGEFNGKLLYDLVTMMNFDMRDIIDELVYQILFQWKTEDEAGRSEMPIRDNDIIGIGKIAGVFQAYGYFSSNTGSLWFTPSHVVNGTERNERGLVNMEREVFEYVQTEKDDYPLDIVTEASVQRRISVVPPGTKPVGYVAEGTKLYETNGNIIWENVLSAPPADKAYVPFFGEKYLVLEEEFIRETALTVPILKLLIECLQKVRHDGPSIALFLKITQILGEGYIYDIEIIQKSISFPERSTRLGGKDATMGRFKIGQVYPSYNHYFYEVQYKRNLNVIVDNQQRRYAVWKMVCDQKFKLFRMVDITKDIGDQ